MQRATITLGGLCLALVACENPSGVGPTEPGNLVQTTPTGAAAASALAFTGICRTLPSLRPPRWRSAADVLDKSIVMVGGRIAGPSGNVTTSRVDAFNVETRSCTVLKSSPIPLHAVIGATTVQGKLYVAGGRSGDEAFCLKTLYVYDLATNSWTRKADMPLRGSHGVQANIHGQLYVFSLYTGAGALFASYNPRTDKWVRQPLSGFQPNHHQSYTVGGAINGKFYLTGGVDASGFDRVLQVYDPATGMGTTKSPVPAGGIMPSSPRSFTGSSLWREVHWLEATWRS